MGLFLYYSQSVSQLNLDDSDEFLMKRRDFFKLVSLPLLVCSCAKPLSHLADKQEGSALLGALELEDISPDAPIKDQHFHNLSKKNVNFDADYPDDVLCPVHQRSMLDSVIKKFRMSQRHIGNGNFNLTSMDEFFNSLKYAPSSERLTKEEIKFIEELFYFDAKKYGFYGEKVFKDFSFSVAKKDMVKVPHSGHYLKNGESLETYNKIIKDVGSTLILTSGVRAMAKQYHLFLEKVALSNYNFSRASRSIAPPGYSFHGHRDFDIGKIGFGPGNFTDEFSSTQEFKKLIDLGYVDIRYEEENNLGVRYEPWHIKV